MGTSGGIGTAAKEGGEGAGGEGRRQEVEKLLLTRLVLGTVGLAGQTAVASASHVASKAYTDLHFEGLEMHRGPDGKVIIGLEAGYEAGSPWEKLKGAFIHQMVENGSERLGGFIKFPGAAKAFQKMSGPQQEAVVKEALFQAFAKKMGAEKAARFLGKANARLAKMEIQGMPQEVLEEYVAALGHTVFEGEEFSPPSFDDITKLMASLVISRSGSMVAEGVMGNDGGEGRMPAEVAGASQAQEGASRTDVDIWKPVTGGGIYAEEEEGGVQEQPRVAFSRGEELTKERQMVKQMQEIAQPGAFRRGPASQAKDFAGIVRDYELTPDEAIVEETEYPYSADASATYKFSHKQGGEALIFVGKDGTVWVQSPDMRGTTLANSSSSQGTALEQTPKGADSQYIQGGDLLYQATMTFAYNNGLKFMPDAAVSDLAKLRRNSHMLSNALRHGTTRHLWPFSEKAKANDSVATQWKEGDSQEAFEHNLALLANQELQNVADVLRDKGIEITDLRYDANSDTIERQTKNPDGTLSSWQRLSEGDFKSLVEGLDPGNSGVGKTTLSRALVIQSALEGQNVVPRTAEHYRPEESLRGGIAPASSGEAIQRVLGSREAPRELYYSRGEASGSERVQRTGVTQAETAAAEARLKSTAQGRAIYGNVLIVDNRAALDGLQGRPGQQRYHAEDWDIMQDAEGFHDPRDGTVVIFRENVRVLEGETAAQALARVVVHERVGHHGFDALRESDNEFAKEWAKLAAAIPADQMKELEGRYKHLNGNREALALEWFAHQVGNMEGRAQLEPGSVVQRMWQAMRDWVVRKMQPLDNPSKEMSQEVIDAHVRGLIRATRRSMVRGRNTSNQTLEVSTATSSSQGLKYSLPDDDKNSLSKSSDSKSKKTPIERFSGEKSGREIIEPDKRSFTEKPFVSNVIDIEAIDKGNVVFASCKVKAGEARFTFEGDRQGDTLIMAKAHIEGDGTVEEILEIAVALGREQGMKYVILQGGKRSTGSKYNRGLVHYPRQIKLKTGL